MPGSLDGQLLLAKAHFLRCDFDTALRCCSICTKADPAFSSAALLQAQILLRSDNYKQAHSVLEQALSHNFSVRESPVFHLAKARVLQTQGEEEEALRVLETALSLPGVQSSDQGRFAAVPVELSAFDRCSVFVLMVEVQLELKRIGQAKTLLERAIFEFSGSTQVRSSIRPAQLHILDFEVPQDEKSLFPSRTGGPHHNCEC